MMVQTTFRTEDETMAMIQLRAELAGVSVNKWMDQAIKYALGSRGAKITCTTTQTWSL